MLRKRSIQLCGEFSLDSTEAKWVHTMRDSGSSRDEMVAAWQNHMKSSPESATLRVDYYLGNVDGAEILKHLSPKEPTSIQFQEKVTDGYWLKAHGVDAEFDILLKTPHLSETEVHTLLANHQENLCWLAYKNSHENPYYPHRLESGVIATPILLDDINPLLT